MTFATDFRRKLKPPLTSTPSTQSASTPTPTTMPDRRKPLKPDASNLKYTFPSSNSSDPSSSSTSSAVPSPDQSPSSPSSVVSIKYDNGTGVLDPHISFSSSHSSHHQANPVIRDIGNFDNMKAVGRGKPILNHARSSQIPFSKHASLATYSQSSSDEASSVMDMNTVNDKRRDSYMVPSRSAPAPPPLTRIKTSFSVRGSSGSLRRKSNVRTTFSPHSPGPAATGAAARKPATAANSSNILTISHTQRGARLQPAQPRFHHPSIPITHPPKIHPRQGTHLATALERPARVLITRHESFTHGALSDRRVWSGMQNRYRPAAPVRTAVLVSRTRESEWEGRFLGKGTVRKRAVGGRAGSDAFQARDHVKAEKVGLVVREDVDEVAAGEEKVEGRKWWSRRGNKAGLSKKKTDSVVIGAESSGWY